ncbi:MAG TPA: LacI family DNA-binding transcriptional regulator [Mycobacteriales bacterium]|nr:LacI family DNA-binding transcriptional regulator [Mycobacteriales bacterium]
MGIRLADVATQAGVSEATVSRVLNGKPGVSAARRAAVVAALDRLGYERPLRLRQRSAGLVGLITPELDNPIFPTFAQAIERDLMRQNYTPVLCTQTPGGATEDEFTDLLVERGVSGILCVSGLHADSTASPDRYTRLLAAGIPIVLINGYMAGVAAPFVSVDDRVATRLAVSHLVELGHRRIGLAVGPRRYVPVIRKIAGFTAAIRELLGEGAAAAEGGALVEHSIFSVEGGQAAGSALLDRGCTGIVCGSDLMALGVIRAARERGLAVPRDVSVVGFDDSPLIAFTDPPLTTVRQPVTAMSAAAVRALLEEIAGNAGPSTEFVFQPDLVVRGSTASGLR